MSGFATSFFSAGKLYNLLVKLPIKMEYNYYKSDTDYYSGDDNDVTIQELTNICDK